MSKHRTVFMVSYELQRRTFSISKCTSHTTRTFRTFVRNPKIGIERSTYRAVIYEKSHRECGPAREDRNNR